mmetsp:Transcript_68231/g.168605  ORF Transcript_68231/g.168605 Transcript_68231/m.168605 type:complete len:100 (+) Transcript_68231:620-919(+)
MALVHRFDSMIELPQPLLQADDSEAVNRFIAGLCILVSSKQLDSKSTFLTMRELLLALNDGAKQRLTLAQLCDWELKLIMHVGTPAPRSARPQHHGPSS